MAGNYGPAAKTSLRVSALPACLSELQPIFLSLKIRVNNWILVEPGQNYITNNIVLSNIQTFYETTMLYQVTFKEEIEVETLIQFE